MPIVRMDGENDENSITILVGIYLCYDETSLIDIPTRRAVQERKPDQGTTAKKGYIRLVGGIVE
jgi:hypothetical protein